MMEKFRVFKMNDYEWWVTDTDLETFYPWYLKDQGLDEEDNPLDEIKEYDIDNEGMWYLHDDEDNLKRLEKELKGYDSKGNGGMGDIERKSDGIYELITFRKAIELSGKYTEPFCIATTNY